MTIPLALLISLAQHCAPRVAPETLLSVAHVESAFDPLTIGINGKPHRSAHPANPAEAARIAHRLLAQGRNLDLGLAQINARNLPRLGLSVEQAFDPCRNLAAAGQILTENYAAASRAPVGEQTALRIAFSVYNTGNPVRGFRNGYVGKVAASAARVVPAIQIAGAVAPPLAPTPPSPVRLTATPSPARVSPSLDVFSRPIPSVWGDRPPVGPVSPSSFTLQPTSTGDT